MDSDTISKQRRVRLNLGLWPPLTVQSDLTLRLSQGVLAHTLVRPVVSGVDVVDGEAGVEPVALDLLLRVVAARPQDHDLFEHPVGDGLMLEEHCVEILISLVVIRDTDQLDTNARIIYSSYTVTECQR